MSFQIRKPTICICETKGADQLYSNCTADQHLCFCLIDSMIPLLLKFEASSPFPWLYRSICVRPGQKPRRPMFSCRGSFSSPPTNSLSDLNPSLSTSPATSSPSKAFSLSLYSWASVSDFLALCAAFLCSSY